MNAPKARRISLTASFAHNMSKLEKADLVATDAQPVHSQNAQPGENRGAKGVSRTDVRYWLERVEKVLGRGGNQSPNYSVQIAHQGHRHRFKLHTSEKRAAAAKAQAIFQTILVNGWETALAEHNPKAKRRTGCATIGEYLGGVAGDGEFPRLHPARLRPGASFHCGWRGGRWRSGGDR
jgi:hypothetical protein